VGLFRLAQHKSSTTADTRSETNRGMWRQDVITRLNERGGGHLVFVRYDKSYTLYGNWVYNNADLNTARVIFAYDFGDEKNRGLIARYRSRSVWLCTLSRAKSELLPYQTPEVATPGRNDGSQQAERQR
jgi:hypothetical protein